MSEIEIYDAQGRLIRDNIEEMTIAEGGRLVTDRVKGVQHLVALQKKIIEEAGELDPEGKLDPTEVADIIDAALDYATLSGYSAEQIEKARQEKRAERGGFLGGVILHIAEVPSNSRAAAAYRSQPDRFPRLK